MSSTTKEEFINESNIEIIQKLMERNNGYIIAKELEDFDGSLSNSICRHKLDKWITYRWW